MTLQADLEEILALAQREVKCPDCGGTKRVSSMTEIGLPGGSFGCGRCQETGQVPDPKYKGLAEALTEECPCTAKGGLVCFHCAPRPDSPVVIHGANCLNCGGSGRVLRTEWQQGALAGVLFQWASCLWKESVPVPEELSELVISIRQCFGRSDCDYRATERVLEYMQEATHAE